MKARWGSEVKENVNLHEINVEKAIVKVWHCFGT